MTDLRADLTAAGQAPTPELLDAIVAQGDLAAPWLMQIIDHAVDQAISQPQASQEEDDQPDYLDDESLDEESATSEEIAEEVDAPPEAWAPIHAAMLLRKMGHTAAVPILLRAYLVTARKDALNYAACQALLGWREAIQPIINIAASTENDAVLDDIFELLATLQVQDDRIFDVFADDLTVNPGAARFLGLYGDKRALPLIAKAFDATLVVTSDIVANTPLFEMADAILELGGSVSDAQKQKLARVQALAQRPRQPLFGKTPGPNEPCHCGSGKKFKKCCGAV